jgi:hypothetical protein
MIKVTGHGRLVDFTFRNSSGKNRIAEAVVASPCIAMGDVVTDDLVFITLLDPMLQQFMNIDDPDNYIVTFSGQARPSSRFFHDTIVTVIEVLPSPDQVVTLEPIHSMTSRERNKASKAFERPIPKAEGQ